jgi:hypothetical protein
MQQIVDFPSLQTAIVEYLARDQDTVLIARIPSFVQLFEAKMNRSLFVRQMETRATAITDPTQSEPEFIALPADFQSMRRIRLASVLGKPQLEFYSPAQLDEFRTQRGDAPGKPFFFTIFGNEIELAPTPAEAITIEMIYRQNIPALAQNNTNWLITLAPDLYLYGALMESAPYIKKDDRLQTWGALFASALNDLNELGKTSTFNAGPLQVRPAGRYRW